MRPLTSRPRRITAFMKYAATHALGLISLASLAGLTADAAHAQSPCRVELQPQTLGDPATQGRFGTKVAAGDFGVAVSQTGSQLPGFVEIFRVNAVTGLYERAGRLDPPPASGGRAFGSFMDSGGEYLAIYQGSDAGPLVHMYRWDGAQLVSEGSLISTSPSGIASFGGSLSVSGPRLALGAPSQDPRSGVFIFERSASGVWTETEFIDTGLIGGIRASSVVHLNGDLLASSSNTTLSPDSGGLIYRYDPIFRGWIVDGSFYSSSSIGGGVSEGLVVGAREGLDASTIAIARPDAFGLWTESGSVTLPLEYDRVSLFGAYAVAFFRPTISSAEPAQPARVALLDPNGPQGFQLSRYLADEWKYLDASGVRQNQFGASVAQDEGRMVIGAPRDGVNQEGRVYVFDLNCRIASEPGCFQTEVNSSGRTGALLANGSPSLADADLALQASRLPPGAMCLFLCSLSQGSLSAPGGAFGTLCLGAPIRRFTAPGQVGPAGPNGVRPLDLPLNAFPEGLGTRPVLLGESWFFQAWYRDGAASTFTDSTNVSFVP